METGKQCWFDFGTKDATKAMAFYKKVLGWEFETMRPDYWLIKVEGETVGGLRVEKKHQPAQGFISYFNVPSLKEGIGMVKKAGGKLVGDSVTIPNNMGHFQIFNDLDNNQIALWSQKP